MRCCSGVTCWCALPALPIPWCEGAIVHALDCAYALLLWVYLLVRPPGPGYSWVSPRGRRPALRLFQRGLFQLRTPDVSIFATGLPCSCVLLTSVSAVLLLSAVQHQILCSLEEKAGCTL